MFNMIHLSKSWTLVRVQLNYTQMSIKPGCFVTNHPFTVVAHAEFLVKLILVNTVHAEKVWHCFSDPHRWFIIWQPPGVVTGPSDLGGFGGLGTNHLKVVLAFFWGLCLGHWSRYSTLVRFVSIQVSPSYLLVPLYGVIKSFPTTCVSPADS